MIEKKLTVEEYIDDPVNTTMINERCIELALGLRYMEKVGNDNLTEVGCVMPHYGYCEHPIIDLFSEDSSCLLSSSIMELYVITSSMSPTLTINWSVSPST